MSYLQNVLNHEATTNYVAHLMLGDEHRLDDLDYDGGKIDQTHGKLMEILEEYNYNRKCEALQVVDNLVFASVDVCSQIAFRAGSKFMAGVYSDMLREGKTEASGAMDRRNKRLVVSDRGMAESRAEISGRGHRKYGSINFLEVKSKCGRVTTIQKISVMYIWSWCLMGN